MTTQATDRMSQYTVNQIETAFAGRSTIQKRHGTAAL